MRRGKVDRCGRDGFAFSSSERRARREERQACDRAPSSDSGLPLRVRVSGAEKVEEQDAVVCVRRSAWASVTEREEFVGRLSFGSRLPQYLEEVKCKSGIHHECERMGKVLDDSDVHWGSRAGAVDFLICHDRKKEEWDLCL